MGIAGLVSLLFALACLAILATPALAATSWPTVTPDPGLTVGTTNIVEANAVDDTYAYFIRSRVDVGA